MRFGEVLKKAQEDLTISRRHDAWLMENDHPRYSPRALEFARNTLTAPERDRKGTVSASSLGECPRYQQFVYLGMPKLPPDQKGAMKMHNGSFMHLRWQLAGLTEGWLARAEVPVWSERYRLSGTTDGVTDDDAVLELKSINAHGFSRVQTFGPLIPHLFQMATYLLCSAYTRGVFIYECKDNQEYKEIPVGFGDLPMVEAAQRADEMWSYIEREELYQPLEKCIDREGWVYHSCPFRDRCLKLYNWGEIACE